MTATKKRTPTPLGLRWGRAIKQAREHTLKCSEQELADMLGVSRQTILYWESGTYVPSSTFQAELVQRLGIDPKTLHDIFSKAT